MAIRRIISRRGQPKLILSDNGTNFHGANNKLKKCMKEIVNEKIKESLFGQQIE